MAGVDGLVEVPGYLGPAEQERLLTVIDGQPWRADLKRRVQHYGYRYDYTRRTVSRDQYLGPLPPWAAELATRLRSDGHVSRDLDQLIVNEYEPGQGISAHVDCVPCFADTVVSISLGSTCVMTYSRRDKSAKVDVLLEPGSLLVMAGPARYDWLHAIAARKSDRWAGAVLPRGRRVSLTFRTVLPSPPAPSPSPGGLSARS